MNQIPRQITAAPATRPTTQAAEGLPRLRWSLAEFERLGELGVFGDDEHIELIDGELVPMASKGIRHENVRGELQNWLIRRLPIDAKLFSEPGWRPGGDNYREPDLLIAPAGTWASQVRPDVVLLLIEVARTSLTFDTGFKARTYAGLGVREYWVVNAVTLETRIFREPGPAGYASNSVVAADTLIVPTLVPALAIKMAALGLD